MEPVQGETQEPLTVQAERWREILHPLIHTEGGGAYEERTLDTKAGSIRILIYKSPQWEPNARHPVYLNMHGGGWVVSKAEMDNAWCRRISDETGAVVVSVDYCKAPEHPYPGALNQCYEVLRWIADTSSDGGATLYALDPNKVILGGFSAGGNMAFTIALKLIQDKDISVKLVMINTNSAQIDLETPYEQQIAGVSDDCRAKSLPPAMVDFFVTVNTKPEERSQPLCSPKFASDDWLAQLPTCVILTAEWDGLHVEANRFAHQLGDAGVHVVSHTYPQSVHPFFNLLPGDPDCNGETKAEATALAIAEMKKAYASA
ncbi:hypothetical protein BZG36_05361 [Bifiguratus adelaidae]|uniref:Alpha/beta hydrolase fold-3 domain-containing protein n=1 Tax=Bifiguratus adelaidae TaxID=1938954 RepID=A0A261XU47_9FUNG|nr:hypothetical protein BZG36_05361 [Bifiguratus adelaidae]